MTDRGLPAALSYLRGLFGGASASAEGDGPLLDRFVRLREESAFALLLERHGPMVWRLCYRLVRNQSDAEDAFQAVFLLLLKKAAGLRNKEHVGPWLYGVAYRVALKARGGAARRGRREGPILDEIPDRRAVATPAAEAAPIVDEEIHRLADKYRLPLILCAIEGHSGAEAAQILGWPEGTVSGRLSRARNLLRSRLARRGIVFTSGLLAGALGGPAQATLPATLLEATRMGALHWIGQTGLPFSPAVTELAQVAARSALMKKLWVLAGVIALGTVLTGAALLAVAYSKRTLHPPDDLPQAPHVEAKKPAAPEAKKELAAGPWKEESRFDFGADAHTARALSPDGRLAAVPNGLDVKLWDESRPRESRNLPGRSGGTAALAFSPEAALLAAAGQDDAIKVWDLMKNEPRWLLKGHAPLGMQASVSSLALTRDLLVSGDVHGRIFLWDLRTGKQTGELQGHRTPVLGLALSPDGKTLVSGELNDLVLVWDVERQVETHRFVHPSPMLYVIGPDNITLALPLLPNETVRLMDLATGKEIGRLKTQRAFSRDGSKADFMQALAFRQDGKVLATGSHDGTLRLWDLGKREPLGGWKGHDAEIYALTFNQDGRGLVSLDSGGVLKRWTLTK